MVRRLVVALMIALILSMLRMTVSAHAAEPEPASASQSPVYVVRAGDTLTAIAARHGTTVAALMSANGIRNADLVRSGQRLTIPGRAAPAAAPKPSNPVSVVSTSAPPADAPKAGRWIDVNISTQRLTAYEDNIAVFTTAISGGLPATPTVLGRFAIRTKLRAQAMSGPGYYLPNVPHVMYFYSGYAIHGAYWHNNFGRPMSHGCVNVPLAAAAWLYNWASVGTTVYVHR